MPACMLHVFRVLQCSESERGSPVTDVVVMQLTDVVSSLNQLVSSGCHVTVM